MALLGALVSLALAPLPTAAATAAVSGPSGRRLVTTTTTAPGASFAAPLWASALA